MFTRKKFLYRTNINEKDIFLSNTLSYKSGLKDHHHSIYLVMKTNFSSEEPKNLIHRDYSKFSPESLKND